MTDIDLIPESLRPAVRRWWEDFQRRYGDCDDAQHLAAELSTSVAVSDFCASVFLRDWNALSLDAEFQPESLANVCAKLRLASTDVAAEELRRIRRRAHCHLIFDELTGRVTTETTLEKLSNVAEMLIDVAIEVARVSIDARHGVLRDSSGVSIPLLVLGMGKLGGRELNFSSDVDLIFVYPREGLSDGKRELSAMEYCARWSRQTAALLDDITEEGFVFRVDTRLRPYGNSGPPVASWASLEAYLLKQGRAWERYAYLKSRVLGEHGQTQDAKMLFHELITPFVYRSYLDFGLLDNLRDIHRLINAEQRGMQDNVKLGPGGIREIEFIVQSIQLLRGGVNPALRTRSLLKALHRLGDSQELSRDSAERLEESYLFLRKLENFIQARRDQQTHELPDSAEDRDALALAMGVPDWPMLLAKTQAIRAEVAGQFSAFAYREAEDTDEFGLLFGGAASLAAWEHALAQKGLDDSNALAEQFVEFRASCERQKITGEALERLQTLIPLLVDALCEVPNAGTALRRCIKLLEKIVRRSAYIALLNENEASLTRLLRLISTSKYIADQLVLFPALLDELLDPRLFTKSFKRKELRNRLLSRLEDFDSQDAEARTERLARFQRHSLFQIAVCDVSDEFTLMQTSDALSWLAESVLDVALDEARAVVEAKFGRPGFTENGKRCDAAFAIVAYGKLGGLELSYESDLDLVFLHDSRGELQVTDGPKSVDNALFFARLVQRLLHILTTRTSSGALYDIDTRLRPSGRGGLLVSGIDAFERYQRDDAWTWEHQSLLRARAVVGEQRLQQAFGALRRKTLIDYTARDSLLSDVLGMRKKMKAELDRSTRERFDLKQGDGGVADLEFIVQYLCLREAHSFPAVIEYTDNIRQIDALASSGVLSATMADELKRIYRAYRGALHRRVLDAKGRLVPATKFVDERAIISKAWKDLLR